MESAELLPAVPEVYQQVEPAELLPEALEESLLEERVPTVGLEVAALTRINKIFYSINAGRSFIRKTLSLPEFVYGPSPNWASYDGQFSIKIESQRNEDCVDMFLVHQAPQIELESEYGKGSFSLEWPKGSYERNLCGYAFDIISKKNLFKRFKMFPVIDSWREFTDLNTDLTWSYWVKQ